MYYDYVPISIWYFVDKYQSQGYIPFQKRKTSSLLVISLISSFIADYLQVSELTSGCCFFFIKESFDVYVIPKNSTLFTEWSSATMSTEGRLKVNQKLSERQSFSIQSPWRTFSYLNFRSKNAGLRPVVHIVNITLSY